MEYGVWSMEYGVWSLEYGVWSLEFGVWSMEFGVWSMKFGVWSLEFGVWCMEFGVWSLEFGVDKNKKPRKVQNSSSSLILPTQKPSKLQTVRQNENELDMKYKRERRMALSSRTTLRLQFTGTLKRLPYNFLT